MRTHEPACCKNSPLWDGVLSSGDVNQTDGLLERDAEFEQLAVNLGAASAGDGRVVVISGPAGVGKTALLQWARRRAERDGMLALRARGVELEQGFAFGVVRQLFERVLLECATGERSRLLRGPARAAGVLFGAAELPELAREDRSFAVVHGVYALAANLAERRPILIVIDDAHWADGPSLRWLSYLAGRVDGLSALAVIARRGGDPGVADASLSGIAAEPGTHAMMIEPLTPTASSVLVERQFGASAAPEFRAACHAATGGNPFFLGELFRALRAARVAPTAEGAARVAQQGPATLARSVLLRTAGLSPEAAALARALAVLGADAELRHAAALASLDDAAAAAAASGLADAQIIVGEQRLSFAHPIVRSSVYADIPSASRARAHARAARLLTADWAAPERVAAHLLMTPGASDDWSVRILEQAAADALDRGAPDSAAIYLRRALAEPPVPDARAHVLAQLGWAEYLAHERAAAVEHLTDALRLTQTTDDRGTLALRASRALVVLGIDRSEEAVSILDRAIPEIPDAQSEVRMRLEAELIAVAGLKLSTRPRQREWLERLHARALGDSPVERLLLANLVGSTVIEGSVPGRFPDLAQRAAKPGSPAQIALELSERALARGQLLQDEGPESPLFYLAADTLRYADWLERSAYWFDRALDAARDRGSPIGFALASAFQAEVAYRTGDLASAEAHARAAMSFAPGDVTAVLVNIMIERGRLADATAILDRHPLDPHSDQLMLQPAIVARGRLAIACGRPREGASDLHAVAAWLERWPVQNPSVVSWRCTLASAAEPTEHEHASQLVAAEVEQARALAQPRALGIALRAQALLEQRADQIDLLREAIAVLEGSPARLEHARALTDLGAALRRNGNRSDAREALRQSLELAHRCEATALADRARTELLATGARPRRIALTGRDSLTATERRIAEMAANGHTTPDIAQALFVTPKTIETHLSHTYRKLNIHSRNELGKALSASE